MWKHRPSALSTDAYRTISVSTLLQCYERDSVQAMPTEAHQGVATIPPRRPHHTNTNNSNTTLRVAQWNVHYFQQVTRPYGNTHQQVFEELQRVNADVVILQEFTQHRTSPRDVQFLRRVHTELGYTAVRIANIAYPTAILARRSVLEKHNGRIRMQQFPLDEDRSAVVLRWTVIHAPPHDQKEEPQPQHVWIYGTHLHHHDDIPNRRTAEMNTLLQHVRQHVHPQNDVVLIVGDFNEPRPQDYLPEEWTCIVANKEYRTVISTNTNDENKSSVDQVLTRAGFTCVWDDTGQPKNWPHGQPPPSSHWSGTLIDYVYSYCSSGSTTSTTTSRIANVGTYVSPCTASDHRLIVTDWNICFR